MRKFSDPLIALGLVLLVSFACGETRSTRPKAPTIDKSPTMQSKRQQVIDEMIARGVFTKVERPGSLPYVFVGPSFYAITVDDKKTFLSVVYAFYYDGSEDLGLIRIFDGRSGKQIGKFSTELGLDLD